jgi:hypothetical protein
MIDRLFWGVLIGVGLTSLVIIMATWDAAR